MSRRAVILAALIVLGATAAQAQGSRSLIYTPHTALSDPVYIPSMKSYVQLFEMEDVRLQNRWANAEMIAQSYKLEEVPGRLAVVNSLQAHYAIVAFLRQHGAKTTWIGGTFDCHGTGRVYWVDGKEVGESGFIAWHSQWNRLASISNSQCSPASEGPMGMFYEPSDGSYRWRVAGTLKAFNHLLVEFPTGGP